MDPFLKPLVDFITALYPLFFSLALVVGSVFALSGFTDLVFDFYNIFWAVQRFLKRKKIKPLTRKRLQAREQQRIAIFIAAWQESEVIADTLRNAIHSLNYKNYDIFVGTYPNDPETRREVDLVADENERVHNVVTPNAGPTNKAANLNHVFNSLLEFEETQDRFYDIILIHDAEDLIHPDSLLVYNYLIPRMDMIQIPVFPVALPLNELTHWTYADEFAENHTKILRVREFTGGFVPSAGVGTAFTKRAFRLLAIEHQEVFSPNSLTEDYQLGLRIDLHGLKAAFVRIELPSAETGRLLKTGARDWVATRALFPTRFGKAVKQKTRWNIGIVLQGWENIGWQGSFSVKWNLFQDRKALLTAPVNFLGYFVLLYFLMYLLVDRFTTQQMPVLIPRGTFLYSLVLISTLFMVWRAFNRALAVTQIYGILPGLTSIPRSIWGNAINFFAILRAVTQYTLAKIRGREVGWDKTSHEFPTGATSQGKSALSAASDKGHWLDRYDFELPPENIRRLFKQRMEKADDAQKISLLGDLSRQHAEALLPAIVEYIDHPSWEVRAAVCRSLSFLRLEETIPYLQTAATDQDWVVRSNAVRALGKMGRQGEEALLDLLLSDDPFARDAARTVLEQQGYLDRYRRMLESGEPRQVHKALIKLERLAEKGGSRLAQEVMEHHQRRISSRDKP